MVLSLPQHPCELTVPITKPQIEQYILERFYFLFQSKILLAKVPSSILHMFLQWENYGKS